MSCHDTRDHVNEQASPLKKDDYYIVDDSDEEGELSNSALALHTNQYPVPQNRLQAYVVCFLHENMFEITAY